MPASSPRIEKMIADLLAREGGYVNHPADRGGPTKYGITEQTARAYGYSGHMEGLTLNMATAIYRARYFIRPGFHLVADVFPLLAEELFDTGVNMGPKRAAEFLQRVVNVLNRRATDYPDIDVDGDIGPATILSLKQLRAKRGPGVELTLIKAVDALQGAYYIELAERSPSQEAFAYGWLSQRLGQAA